MKKVLVLLFLLSIALSTKANTELADGYNYEDEFIADVYDFFGVRSKCEPLKYNEKKRVFRSRTYSYSKAPSRYSILKTREENRDAFYIGFNFLFFEKRALREKRHPGTNIKVIKTDNPKLNELMQERVNACFKEANPYLKGPNGEKLEFYMDKRAPQIRIKGSYEKTERAHAKEFSFKEPCNVIIHEVFHWMGLIDEYKEKHIQVEVRDEEGNISEENFGNCRIQGPFYSIMNYDHFRYAGTKHGIFDSLLDKRHFDVITEPGCLKPNEVDYSACSQYVYHTVPSNGDENYPMQCVNLKDESCDRYGFDRKTCNQDFLKACYNLYGTFDNENHYEVLKKTITVDLFKIDFGKSSNPTFLDIQEEQAKLYLLLKELLEIYSQNVQRAAVDFQSMIDDVLTRDNITRLISDPGSNLTMDVVYDYNQLVKKIATYDDNSLETILIVAGLFKALNYQANDIEDFLLKNAKKAISAHEGYLSLMDTSFYFFLSKLDLPQEIINMMLDYVTTTHNGLKQELFTFILSTQSEVKINLYLNLKGKKNPLTQISTMIKILFKTPVNNVTKGQVQAVLDYIEFAKNDETIDLESIETAVSKVAQVIRDKLKDGGNELYKMIPEQVKF